MSQHPPAHIGDHQSDASPELLVILDTELNLRDESCEVAGVPGASVIVTFRASGQVELRFTEPAYFSITSGFETQKHCRYASASTRLAEDGSRTLFMIDAGYVEEEGASHMAGVR